MPGKPLESKLSEWIKKPRILIAPSKDNVKYAHAVHRFLNNSYAYTKLWETAVAPAGYTLPALLQTFDDYDFGIFLFSEDDMTKQELSEFLFKNVSIT